jgi:Fe-Mn family superoxide dismutase
MFTLPELPFAADALEPHMSAETMKFHHGKHHKSYVEKLNELAAVKPFKDMSLEEIIAETNGETDHQELFNNAAQHWNHSFFWLSLSPKADQKPTGDLADQINADFGSFDDFCDQFTDAAVKHFGSGWAWLVAGNQGLEIMTTHDADLPMVHGKTALLTCDLWEHAYYLDYQNMRQAYISAFLVGMANWQFAESNLAEQTNLVSEMN